MRLRLITIIIITLNVLLLYQDVPNSIMVVIVSSLFASLLITGKMLRTVIKIGLLIFSIILLKNNFKTLLVTECGVSFVMLLSALKFWELDDERDHFNMFLILSLCECSIFLLNPTFLIFSFGIIKMLFYFYYILKIRNYDISLLNPKRLLLLIAPSIIFSLILFYTFPRFTQGFLNTNDIQQIISGGSSKINFKELGPLTLSTEKAFKVYGLENSNLPFSIIYWRTSVLWQYSHQEWRASYGGLNRPNPVLINPRLKYDVEVYQNFKEFLPTLDGESSIIYSSLNFNSYSEETFRVKAMTKESLNYTVVGNYGQRPQAISLLMLRRGLKISSPQIDEIKKSYFKDALNSSNDEERLRELIKIFKNRIFEYSLNPPVYKSIEDFLLKGKTGYCSHFATAFTFLARIYNLPARMVVGYLGGEFNPYDNSVLVKELDAHTWVEVFIESKGWVKVDPTALVAPARIEMSAEQFNKQLNPYITFLNFKVSRDIFNFTSINNFSLWLDSLNSKFNTNIFNFDRTKQLAFLRSITPASFSPGWIFVIALITCMPLFWLVFYLYGKKKVNPDEKRYIRFLNKMNNHGLQKKPYETITIFRLRCLENSPGLTNYIDSEVSHYLKTFYK